MVGERRSGGRVRTLGQIWALPVVLIRSTRLIDPMATRPEDLAVLAEEERRAGAREEGRGVPSALEGVLGGANAPPTPADARGLAGHVSNTTLAALLEVQSSADTSSAGPSVPPGPHHETVGDMMLKALQEVDMPPEVGRRAKKARLLALELDPSELEGMGNEPQSRFSSHLTNPAQHAACYATARRLQEWLAEPNPLATIEVAGETASRPALRTAIDALTNDLRSRAADLGTNFLYRIFVAGHGFALILRTIEGARVVEHLESFAGGEKGLLLAEHAARRKTLTVDAACTALTQMVGDTEAERNEGADALDATAGGMGLLDSQGFPSVRVTWQVHVLKPNIRDVIQQRVVANVQQIGENLKKDKKRKIAK